MRRRELLSLMAGVAATAIPVGDPAIAAPRRRQPNFLVILCDDLGYGDIEPTGGRLIKTPNLNRFAAEGMQLTDYYAPANLCTPSRAGMLTGRYPVRTGLGRQVIQKDDPRGLPLTEVTIAETLRPDYATALIGKWHLGHLGAAWPPTKHGYDYFFGLPYSHDMADLHLFEAHTADPPKPMPADLPTLQQQFCAKAQGFIEANKARPFYLQLNLSTPHLPNWPHPPFEGKSPVGGYGDVVQEIDAIVGRLMASLKSAGVDNDTLVIFTSDNGPWFEGSPGKLRGRKGGSAYDGGYRVPCLARQPGVIPAGRKCDSIIMGIDLLPTFCAMAGRPLPAATLDGKDIGEVLRRGAASPHDQLVLFDNEEVVGLRTQRWKYVASDYYRSITVPMAERGYAQLYDLTLDAAENYSVAARHPDVVKDMQDRLARAKATFAPFKTTTP